MTRFVPIRWITGAVTAVALALLNGCGGGSSGPQGPVITAASAPAGTTGVAYSYTLMASGGVQPLSWSETGSMPPGLTLNTSGDLTGTPGTAGSYPVMVTVSDSSTQPLTAQMQLTLVINDSTIVIAATPAPPAGTLTYPYPGFGFSASGGSPPYTWQATGSMPPGLAVGSDGSVSGTPTAAGSFSFSVTATDSAQTPVSGPSLKTQIVISTPGTLVLNAMPAPPAGVGGSGYPAFTFSTTGGYLPLMWSITAGNLPPGLTLGSDGSLGGTPTQVGTFTFTVTVKDSAPTPASSSQSFTINIAAPPPPTIATSEAPTGTVGAVYAPFQFSTNGGLAPFLWTESGALDGLAVSSSGVLSGTPIAAGKFPITLDVTDALNRTAPSVPVIVRVSLARSGAFTLTTGSMTVPRFGHTATLLLSGQVLVAGGSQVIFPVAAEISAELYDPTSKKFTPTGEMKFPRYRHTATLLADAALPKHGMVLMVGEEPQTAELYDPLSRTFTATGTLLAARSGHTATLLKTGKVLIAGGATATTPAELYDPSSGTFTATGILTAQRVSATATLLVNGDVLIAGGETATAELYNPTSGKFAATGSMSELRTGHTATLLTDGTVLMVGPDVTAELYNPATRRFTPVGILPVQTDPYIGRTPEVTGSTATLWKDGTVLVAGGYYGHYPLFQSLADAELYAMQSEGFTFTGSLNTERDGHKATLLGDGTVLMTGGINHKFFPASARGFEVATVLSSAELFK